MEDPMSFPRFARRFDLRRRTALLLVALFVLTLIPVTSRPAEAINIVVAWKVGGLPSSQTTDIDASGHPTSAIVRVPADMGFWYDPTPFEDEEFTMEPRLYRDTHPAEQVEAF